MDNPEKMATQFTEDEEKQNKPRCRRMVSSCLL